MAYNRLVGLEKGKRAFLGCFLMSAAGCVRTRARTRKGFGLSFLFRKQNRYSGKFRKQNTGFPSLFRKLNSVGRFVFWLKNGQRVFSVVLFSCYLKSGGLRLCVYVHTRARWLRSFSFCFFLSEKTLFSFSFFLYIFLSSFSFFCKSIILFIFSLS